MKGKKELKIKRKEVQDANVLRKEEAKNPTKFKEEE